MDVTNVDHEAPGAWAHDGDGVPITQAHPPYSPISHLEVDVEYAGDFGKGASLDMIKGPFLSPSCRVANCATCSLTDTHCLEPWSPAEVGGVCTRDFVLH